MRWWKPLFLLGILSLASATQADDQRLDIVAPWEIGSTDPSKSGHIFLRMQIAETLIDADAQGRLVPSLATGWQVGDDQREWRFTLRNDVHFHDGTLMTADTVVASLKQALAKTGALSQADIQSIEADGGEVVIRLATPFAPLPALLAHASTQILAPGAYAASGEVTEVIGTGPYRAESVQPPQRLIASRFEDYWGDAPAIEHTSYLAAPRSETRALMAQSGDADIVFNLGPASRMRLKNDPSLTLHAEPIPRTIVLKLNAAHPYLDEVKARKAISLAIDRAGIAAGVLRMPGASANQLFPPSLETWHLDGLGEPNQNLDDARAALAELGWHEGADGILERDGERFQLTLRTFSDRPELPVIATVIQDQLRRVGIDLEVAVSNASAIPAGHHDGSLEMGLMARNFGLVPDPLTTLLSDYGAEGGDWGAMNWSDPRLVEILDTLKRSEHDAAYANLAEQAASILHQQLPVIPIAWYLQTAAVNQRLIGFAIDPFERSYKISDMRWKQ